MMADEAAVDDARRVPALPQDHRVEIAFEGAAEIGRFARAKANIAAGEAVLMAAPFTTVFNPNTYVSALQLLCGAEAEVVGGGGVASNKKALPRGKAKATRHTDPATPSRSSMHLTHANTYCSCCFQPIPAGSALLNAAELKDLAVDVSIEQDEIDESLRCTEEQHLAEEGEHDIGVDAPASAAAKRLKKPTKSAKMRSDTHVELQQRLRQKALDQRQVLMEEHRLKREAEPPRPPSCAVASFDECQAELATSSVVVGCEGCGIVCYCSKQCFQAYDAIHRGSGECCVLRRLFPIIMRHYYSPSTGARRRQGGGEEASAVLMPGEEPKRWGRNTGEEQCWEAQGILLAALVVMRRNLEGYATPPATPPPRDARSCNDDVGTTTPAADAGTSTCRSSVVPGGVVESSALPAEVLAMQRTRRTLGLDKIVEVLEPNPARRSTEEPHPPPHANGEGYLPTHVEVVSGDGQRRSIRLPRYADIAEMVSNESVMTKDRSGLYARYYRKYCRLLAPISMGVAGISLHLPEYLFFRICAVAQCNSFGIYTPEDRSVGFSIYPEASYFNHSCLPNLCRVMTEGGRAAVFYALRPISAGEALTICYTDVQELDSSVRRINLLGTYRFYCGCERCAGSASLADGRVELCDRCAIKGYLRPLPSSASTLSVRLRCTICGHERMRTDFPRATQA